jgi:hypothetical protein
MIMNFGQYIKENYKSNNENNTKLVKLFHISKFDDKITKTRLGVDCFIKPIDIEDIYYYYIEIKPNKTFITTKESLINDVLDIYSIDEKDKLSDNEYSQFKINSILKNHGYDTIKLVDSNEYYIIDVSCIKEIIHLNDYKEALEYYNNVKKLQLLNK